MRSHELAKKLLALPDQFVYIHPTDKDKAYPCDSVSQRLNGLVLTPQITKATEKQCEP